MNFRSTLKMKIPLANNSGVIIGLVVLITNYVQTFPQSWNYPGLWYYSHLPSVYHFRRQVHPPQQQPFSQILKAPFRPSPYVNPSSTLPQSPSLLQQSRSILPPKRKTPSMIRDRCEKKNWGNLVGKCRMSCNIYDGTCTETLITTDCGCDGVLNVK